MIIVIIILNDDAHSPNGYYNNNNKFQISKHHRVLWTMVFALVFLLKKTLVLKLNLIE